jgi:choline dehydrogenase-like flavoprotein
MIYDANDIDRSKINDPPIDICIVGAGAAGIAMAHSLIGSGKRVVVLEASRHNDVRKPDDHDNPHRYEDRDIQPLYDGVMVESDGITKSATEGKTSREFFLRSRIKAYGGTTNCWEGWTRPQGDVDFARWPAGVKEELFNPNGRREDQPYQRAMRYCSFPSQWAYPDAYHRPGFWIDMAKAIQNETLAEMPNREAAGLQTEVVVQMGAYSETDRDFNWAFQRRWGPDLKAAQNVTVYLNANVRKFDLGSFAGADFVKSVLATTVKRGPVKGDDFTVTAKTYVLAASCIENVRLMLHSGFKTSKLPALGRYLMTHPLIETAAYFQCQTKPPESVAGFCGGTTIKTKDTTPPIALAMLAPTKKQIDDKKIGNYRAWLQIPETGVMGNVNLCWEQQPVPDNYVTLDGQATDTLFGDPLPRVRIALGKTDWDTRGAALDQVNDLVVVKNKYTDFLARTGEIPRVTGEHALGATRMADDFNYGVVNRNCFVHQCVNLSVAGGSVFPAGGWANPTLTIIALALRLADRLRKPAEANVSTPAGSPAAGG